MDGVVSPVDHNKLVPEVVKTELPQLFVTVTTGVAGAEQGGLTHILSDQLVKEPPSTSNPSAIVNVHTPVEFSPLKSERFPEGWYVPAEVGGQGIEA
jgi:hypothetical protein